MERELFPSLSRPSDMVPGDGLGVQGGLSLLEPSRTQGSWLEVMG